MNSGKIFFTVVGFVALSILPACGAKDSDKVGDAQYCLDTATASTASDCAAKVDGIETPGAYIIRCSADFIEKGFGDPAQLVSTFKNLDNSGASTTTAFLAALNFTDLTFANTTYNDCVKTQQKGLTLLAAMVNAATSIAALGDIAGGASCTSAAADATTIQNCISNLVTSYNSGDAAGTQAATAVGQTVLTVYQTTCGTGSQVNATLCTQMNTALTTAGSTDPATIGAALIQAWASQ